ncbi:MAG: hypothetical protein WAV84_17480 [Bacteroidota bacterium]
MQDAALKGRTITALGKLDLVQKKKAVPGGAAFFLINNYLSAISHQPSAISY